MQPNGDTRNDSPSAFLLDGTLVLTNFRETDPEVIGLLADADDVEATVHAACRSALAR